MLIVHGVYYFRRTRVSYRNDYCLSCDGPRLAFQYRTFDVAHVFWIPVLPLGFWRRWNCAECGADPHASTRSRPTLLWLGVLCLVFMTVAFWMAPPRGSMEDVVVAWCFRIGGPIATIAAIRSILNRPEGVNLRERLRAVEPNMSALCPFCDVELEPRHPRWRCPSCGIERAALRPLTI